MIRRRLLVLLKVVLVVFILFFAFLLFERIRGQISLARYRRELIARGEKLSAKDLVVAVAPGENGAP
jgi:hypothetical protein